MQVYFNSRDPQCKTPFGAVKSNETITFSVFSKDGVFVDKVFLRVYPDGQEEPIRFPLDYVSTVDNYSRFSVQIPSPDVGLYWYSFEFYTENGIEIKDKNGCGYQLTVYDENYNTPDYVKGGVIYHIFVDRFNKGNDLSIKFNKKGVLKDWDAPVTIVDPDGVYRANDFYGGNFQGIIDKLDYLKELGVTLIYLSPIFKSASTHRYDTGNYLEVDELLGSEKKFQELIEKAKEKGMEIMLDGVFNHTGADSLYFNKFGNYDSIGAYQAQNSPYYNWYTFYEFPDNYHCWWGVTVCPTIRPAPNGFRDLITNSTNGVIKKWTSLGVKGWRLDVVDELAEDFVKDIRTAIKKCGKDNLMIGEVWEDASNKIAYDTRRHYFQGEELDGVMNYVFKVAILNYSLGGSVGDFISCIDEIIENYPKESLDVSMNLIGSHDTLRVITVLAGAQGFASSKEDRLAYKLRPEDYQLGVQRLKIASAIQFILPGVPSIYYGDEIGMQGFEDPMNREPMRWNSINESLHTHYINLGKMRAKYRDAMQGAIELFDDDMLIIKRIGKDVVTLVANTAEYRRTYVLDHDAIDLLTGKIYEAGRVIVDTNNVYIFVNKE